VRIGLGLIGPGLVGKELLRQIGARAAGLKAERGLEISLLGVARSQVQVVSGGAGIPFDAWEESLQSSGAAANLGESHTGGAGGAVQEG